MPLKYITDTGTGNRSANAEKKLDEAKQQAKSAAAAGTPAAAGKAGAQKTGTPAAGQKNAGGGGAKGSAPAGMYTDAGTGRKTAPAGNTAADGTRKTGASTDGARRFSTLRQTDTGTGKRAAAGSAVTQKKSTGPRGTGGAGSISAYTDTGTGGRAAAGSAGAAGRSGAQSIESRQAELRARSDHLARESALLEEMLRTAQSQERQLEALRAQIEQDPQQSYIDEYMSILAQHDRLADSYNSRAALQQGNIKSYNRESERLEQDRQARYYSDEYGEQLKAEAESARIAATDAGALFPLDGDPNSAEGRSYQAAKEKQTRAEQAYSDWLQKRFTHDQSQALDQLDEETMGYINAMVDYNIEVNTKSRGTVMNGAAGYASYDTDIIAAKKEAEQALLAAGYSKEEIASLTEYQEYRRNAEDTAKMITLMEEETGRSWGSAVMANAASVVLSPMQGLGMMEFLNRRVNEYAPLDVNSANFAAVNMVEAVRSKTSAEIMAKTDSEALGQTLSFLYQTGMSIADSGTLIAAAGPASVYLMGTSAAASTAKDATERGASAKQAFVLSLAAGAAEVLTEKFSVENLLNNVNSPNTVRAMLRQAGVEASEEMTSEAANIIADTVIMGDKSSWHARTAEYMAAGMSEQEAERRALLDSLTEIGLAGLGGAISGGVMAGVGGGVNSIRANAAVDRGMGQLLRSGYQTGTQYAGEENQSNSVRLSLSDFANTKSPTWNNIEYDDVQTQNTITQQVYREMVEDGQVVRVPSETIEQTAQAYPDLRSMRKADRTVILKEKMNELKSSLRQFLNGLKGSSFEFDVNGNILEAKLYDTGIKEVLSKITQDKASMLMHSDQVFENARYLYSMPDYEQNHYIYRWNYFLTPVQIGDDGADPVAVRIAVRDMVETSNGELESQIYNWGIKKNAVLSEEKQGMNTTLPEASPTTKNAAALDGGSPSTKPPSPGVSSAAADTTIQRDAGDVKREFSAETGDGLFSQEETQRARRRLEQMRGIPEGSYEEYAAEGDVRPLRTFAQQQAAELAEGINETLAPYGITVRADTSGTLEGTDCMIDLASGEILIGPEVTDQDVFDYKLRHELGHAAAAADPALVSETLELARGLGYDIDAIRQEKALSYFDALEARGYTEEELVRLLTDEYLDEEIFGDLVWALDRDGTLMNNMAQRAPNLLTRILDCLRSLLARLTGRVEDARLRNYRRIADNIRVTLGIEGEGTWGSYNGDMAGSGKYSLSETLESDFQTWFDAGKPDRKTILIGETSDALKSIGAESRRIYWDTSKINKIQRDHIGMSDSVIAQVPYIVENPVIIMESKTMPNRLTMYGEVYNDYGVPVMAVIELLPTTRNNYELNEFKIVNAYGKDNNNDPNAGTTYTQRTINSSTILYVDPDENRTNNWLSRNQLQLPLGIDQYGPIGTISYVHRDSKGNYSSESENQIIPEWKKLLEERFNPRSMGDDRWMYEDGVRLPTAEDTRPFNLSDEDVGAEMDAARRERDGIMLPRAGENTDSDGIMLPRADEEYYSSMLGEAENSPDWMGRRPGNNRTNRTAPEETADAFTADDIDEYEQYMREINRPVEPKAVYDADLKTLPKKAQNYLERTKRGIVNYLAELLGVPKSASREFLMPVAGKAAQEYINTGDISTSTMKELFDEAYNRAVVIDNDYYEQYKEVRDRLRTTPVTISAADTADIADYDRWRRSQFNTLRIVNEGGTPVDTLYSELSNSYPELFPEYVTAPGDMLKRMSEVVRSIRKTETTLDSYYGEHAGDLRRELYNQFSQAMDKFSGEFNTVRRFYAEQEQKRLDAENFAARGNLSGNDVQTVKERWQEVKRLRREAEKASSKNFLTDEDNRIVDMLLRGKMRLEDVPSGVNRRGITEVYHARQLYQAEMKELNDTNRAIKARYRAEADGLLQDANQWKDKAWGISYERETMERNVRDITGGSEAGEALIEHYFTPVHRNEAERTRAKNRYRDRVRALELSRKTAKGNTMSESAAVQFYGEAADYIAQLERTADKNAVREGKNLEEWRAAVRDFRESNPNLDMDKIQRSVEEFRRIYDELFEQMNETRIRNGYEPVDYRKGYFPHFTEEKADGVLEKFGRMLGLKIRMDVTELPTSINGLTHTFRPGIRWFGSAQRRTGFATEYDALEGFDRYIEGVTDVIYHTDDIQRLRALSSQMRYRTTDAGLQKQIDEIRAREDLSEYDKDLRIKDVQESGRYTLSKFVNTVEEYTNLLANKRARGDRDVENALNRRFYNTVKTFSNRVAANMVAVNPGSWLTNFIPLVQGKTQLSWRELGTAMKDTLRSYHTDDGFALRSDFLTNRRGSDVLVQTAGERISGKLSSPMEYIDRFVADTLVRARYAQNTGKAGMSDIEALDEANAWASEIMADRSKGATPIVFEQKNPLTKLFTQFQLEVNNQMSWMLKDLPRRAKEKDKWAARLTAMLIQYALGAWVYNEIYEAIVGRRAAFDPIDIAGEFAGDLRDEDVSLAEAVSSLGENALSELPFVGGLMGGGRLPISTALPDVRTAATAAADLIQGENDRRYNAGLLIEEAAKPALYGLLPFGGGQLKKAVQGIMAVVQGGSYSVNKEGGKELQYPVYNDSAGDVIKNTAKGVLFGPTSTEGGQDWINSGFEGFTARETAVYQGLTELGRDGREAISLIEEITAAEDDGPEDRLRAGEGPGVFRTREEKQRMILDGSGLSEEEKAIVWYGLLAGGAELKSIDALVGEGTDEAAAVIAAYRLDSAEADTDAGGKEIPGSLEQNRFAALDGMDTTDGERLKIYYAMAASGTARDNIDALRGSGLDDGLIYSAISTFAGCTGEYDGDGRLVSGSAKAEKGTALDGLDAYDSEKLELYYQLIASEEELEQIDALRGSGLDSSTIYQGIRAVGSKTKTDDKFSALRRLQLPEEDAAAIYFTAFASSSHMEKYDLLHRQYGFTAEEFYRYMDAVSADRYLTDIHLIESLGLSEEKTADLYFEEFAGKSERETAERMMFDRTDYYTFLRDTADYEKTLDWDGDVISGSVTAQQMEYLAQREDFNKTDRVYLWLNAAASPTQRTMYEQNVRGARDAGIGIYTLACFITELFASTNERFSTKKEKVMAYIDSLELNSEQKDYLYLMEYSASGLKNTPWHTGEDYSRYLAGNYDYGE